VTNTRDVAAPLFRLDIDSFCDSRLSGPGMNAYALRVWMPIKKKQTASGQIAVNRLA
jgi:hypothetical protein